MSIPTEPHDPICPMADPTRRSLSCMCTWIEAAKVAEHTSIGVWLEKQAQITRYAKHGQHPETAARTQAAVLGWAAAQVLSGRYKQSADLSDV